MSDDADREAFEALWESSIRWNDDPICRDEDGYSHHEPSQGWRIFKSALAWERAKTAKRIAELEAALALSREDCSAYRAQFRELARKWHDCKTALDEAEGALEPFAEAAESYDDERYEIAWAHDFTVKSLRRACAALAAIRTAKENGKAPETQNSAADPKAGGADDGNSV